MVTSLFIDNKIAPDLTVPTTDQVRSASTLNGSAILSCPSVSRSCTTPTICRVEGPREADTSDPVESRGSSGRRPNERRADGGAGFIRCGHEGSGRQSVVESAAEIRFAKVRMEHMNGEPDQELGALIRAIPEGWTRVQIDGRGWGITRTTRAGGKTISFDAERLGSKEYLGANVWNTSEGSVLRPCEVPEERVMQLLRDAAATFEV